MKPFWSVHFILFSVFQQKLVFGTDNFLSVHIIRDTKANITNITGLAGHREDGFYIMRNNTKVSENASALSFFQFGESCTLYQIFLFVNKMTYIYLSTR
jgi:hypothetical protein